MESQWLQPYTVDTAVYQIDKFHRCIWAEVEDGYNLPIITDHADRFIQHIVIKDWNQSYKVSLQKAVKREVKYRKHWHSGTEWDPEFSFFDNGSTHQPRYYLSKEERVKIREAELAEYDIVVPPVDRRLLADRLADLVYYVRREFVGRGKLTISIHNLGPRLNPALCCFSPMSYVEGSRLWKEIACTLSF